MERYLDLHERIIPNIIESHPEKLLRRYSSGMNSPLWIYWHFVRTEDLGVSRFIMNSREEYPEWAEKVGMITTLNGTGMNMSQVKEFSAKISLAGLKGYRQAVKTRTLRFVENVNDHDLAEIVSTEHIDRVICRERTMPEEAWDLLPLYYGKSREWFLLHVCLTHPFYHLGQIGPILKSLDP